MEAPAKSKYMQIKPKINQFVYFIVPSCFRARVFWGLAGIFNCHLIN